VPEFKSLFMNDVAEAANLPDRHLYVDDEEAVEESEDVVELAEERDAPLLNRAGNGKVAFKTFLHWLVASAEAFGQIVLASTGDKQTDRHLRNLKMIKAAQSYGYLMYLRVRGVAAKDLYAILKLTESFMLRRHVCRERTNETEALYAKLCVTDPKNALSETRKTYRAACPPDERFLEEFAKADFSANLDRARYCLERIENLRHGTHSELHVAGPEDVHVEHIIPEKIKTKKARDEFGDWVAYLGENAEELHPKFVSMIGNLTLVAGSLNIIASNNPFASKKKEYRKSGIEITRELCELSAFKFKQVTTRSRELAETAIDLWPKP